MKRYAILGLALAVVAALVLLVAMLRRDAQSVAERSSSRPRSTEAPSRRSAAAVERAPRPAPPAPTIEPEAAPAPGTAPRRYMRPDGVRVTDHRARPGEPDLTRAIPSPPGRAKVARATVLTLHNAVRPIVDKCAKELDHTGLDARPSVRVDTIIDIAGENLTVALATVIPKQIPDPAARAMVDCIKAPVEALTLAVAGEGDLSSYTLSLPYLVGE